MQSVIEDKRLRMVRSHICLDLYDRLVSSAKGLINVTSWYRGFAERR